MVIKFFPSDDSTDRRDYIFFLIFSFGLLPVTAWGSSDIVMVLMAGAAFYYIYIVKKETIDTVFYVVLAYWLIINLFSFLIVGGAFSIGTLIGSCIKLFLSYAIIKIVKERIISWFEHLVFVLGVLSLLFFTIQLINHQIFFSLPFNFVRPDRFLEGHWNAVIFNYNATEHETQNSGFAGEPGTFGYYVGLAMIFNLILNQGKMNKKFIFFIILGLTTVSTNYYISLVLFIGYYLLKLPPSMLLLMLAFIIPTGFVIYQLPFISGKIDLFINQLSDFRDAEILLVNRINRLAIFVNDLNDISFYPFGHGVNNEGLTKNVFGRIITGTNGISRLGVRYGVFGMIYFLVIYQKLLKKISLGMTGYFLFVLIIFMYIAANPMERDYFIMPLFWLYFLVNQDDIKSLIEKYQLRNTAFAFKSN